MADKKQFLFCRWQLSRNELADLDGDNSEFHVSCGAGLYDPDDDDHEVKSEQFEGFFESDARARLLFEDIEDGQVLITLTAPAEPLLRAVSWYNSNTKPEPDRPNAIWRYWLSPSCPNDDECFQDNWGIYAEDELPV